MRFGDDYGFWVMIARFRSSVAVVATISAVAVAGYHAQSPCGSRSQNTSPLHLKSPAASCPAPVSIVGAAAIASALAPST